MSRSHDTSYYTRPDVYDDARSAGAGAAGSSAPKRPRSPEAADRDREYDYYGSADWYGGAGDYWGGSRGGASADPHYDYDRRDYRAEWDAYYREREWEEYERRNSYYGRDRHDLRSRIEGMAGAADNYGRENAARDPALGPPPALGGKSAWDAPDDSRMERPDPLKSDQLMSYRQYQHYHKSMNRPTEPSGDPYKDYQEYRQGVLKRQMQVFFEQHKDEKWFKEKYSPAQAEASKRLERKRLGRQGRKAKWIAELKGGKLDEVCFDVKFAKQAGVPAKGPTSKDADQKVKEEKGAEVKMEEDVKPKKEGESEAKKEEESSDLKKEEKQDEEGARPRESDRAEDANGDEQNGHAGANGRPTSPTVSRGGDRGGDGSGGSKPLIVTTRFGEQREEASQRRIDPDPHQLLVQNIAPEMDRTEIEELFKKHAGTQFRYLAVSDVREHKRWSRLGFAVFNEGTDVVVIRDLMTQEKVAGIALNVTLCDRPAWARYQTVPDIAGSARRLKQDLHSAKEMIARFELEDREKVFASALQAGEVTGEDADVLQQSATALIEERCNTLGLILKEATDAVPEEGDFAATGDELAKVRRVLKKHVDLHLDLLREVYHCDYYLAVVRDFPEELVRRSPATMRKVTQENMPEPVGEAARLDSFSKNLDAKLAQVITPETLVIEELGGKNLEEVVLSVAGPYIKEEDKEKHRCTVTLENGNQCGKLFKSPVFVQKHISNKHKAFLDELAAPKVEDAVYLNNYILDPSRPLPSAGFGAPPANERPFPAMNGMPMPPEMMAMMQQMMGGMPFDMSAMMNVPQGGDAGRGRGNKRPRREADTALGQRLGGRMGKKGGRDNGPAGTGEPLANPGPLDPRASHGKRSYHDLDGVPDPAKDVELQY